MDIDVIVYCINLSLAITQIKKNIECIKSKHIEHIFWVISSMYYEDNSFVVSEGVKPCLGSETDQKQYYSELYLDKEINVPIYFEDRESIAQLTKDILKLYGI